MKLFEAFGLLFIFIREKNREIKAEMRKYLFNSSWLVCFSFYVFLFLFGLGSVCIVSDEYDGGDRLSEFGADLFQYVLAFPANTIDFLLNKPFKISDGLALLIFVLNSILNCIIVTTVINFLYMQVERFLKRVRVSRPN